MQETKKQEDIPVQPEVAKKKEKAVNVKQYICVECEKGGGTLEKIRPFEFYLHKACFKNAIVSLLRELYGKQQLIDELNKLVEAAREPTFEEAT